MHNCGRNIPFKDVAFIWEGVIYTVPFQRSMAYYIVILVEKETLKKEKRRCPWKKVQPKPT